MKWTKLVKAEKYPKIVKEGNIYHVLYAEGTKSKQFESKEEAEKYCKSIKSGIVPTKDITLDNGKKYTVRYNPSNKSILAIFENGKEIGVDAGTRLQLLRKLFHKGESTIVEEKPVKAGESYGWYVDPSEAWDKLQLWVDAVGAEQALDDIAKAMGTDELSECLAFIFRNNDFRESLSEEEYDEETDEDYIGNEL